MSSITGRLLDLWLPPDGAGRALGCLATTFTFDAEFFEQQCVGRFLGLDTRPGEAASDIGFLIEREEKLAETPVSVIAERRLNPDSRSLRWDILPVGGPTGVMHAKVAVLVWEHVVRLIISSANLSEQAFRRSLELAVAFDAHADAELPQSVFEEILGAVERIIRMAPASRNAGGPRPRALEILARARDRLVSFDLPQRPARGTPRIAVVMPRTGEDALTGALRTWSGGPPRWGTVMSPYFDVTDGPSRAAVRLVEVLAKRNASVDFVVPVEHLGNHEVARLPRSLQQAMPSRITVVVRDVKQPNPAEPRRLHGKLILLESDSWITALVGSSNFSAAGLGLDGGGNVEIGIAVGAPQGTPVAKTLRSLALAGEEVGLHADYEGEDDPEEKIPPVPAGFVQVLGEPGPPAALELELDRSGLPAWWAAGTPDGRPLIDSDTWSRAGHEPVVILPTPTGDLPFNLALEWRDADGVRSTASLPVNVTDPGRLPAPAELRTLPLDALLRALASVRPLHEGIVDALTRREQARAHAYDELDPLRRFSPTGQLLYRTRELSAALAGLHERLERPAATLEAFMWRIDGPFGPIEIADKLIAERRENRSVQGEESFMLAEISLTLASLDLGAASRFIPKQRSSMENAVHEAVRALESKCERPSNAPALEEYVQDAFTRAKR